MPKRVRKRRIKAQKNPNTIEKLKEKREELIEVINFYKSRKEMIESYLAYKKLPRVEINLLLEIEDEEVTQLNEREVKRIDRMLAEFRKDLAKTTRRLKKAIREKREGKE